MTEIPCTPERAKFNEWLETHCYSCGEELVPGFDPEDESTWNLNAEHRACFE